MQTVLIRWSRATHTQKDTKVREIIFGKKEGFSGSRTEVRDGNGEGYNQSILYMHMYKIVNEYVF